MDYTVTHKVLNHMNPRSLSIYDRHIMLTLSNISTLQKWNLHNQILHALAGFSTSVTQKLLSPQFFQYVYQLKFLSGFKIVISGEKSFRVVLHLSNCNCNKRERNKYNKFILSCIFRTLNKCSVSCVHVSDFLWDNGKLLDLASAFKLCIEFPFAKRNQSVFGESLMDYMDSSKNHFVSMYSRTCITRMNPPIISIQIDNSHLFIPKSLRLEPGLSLAFEEYMVRLSTLLNRLVPRMNLEPLEAFMFFYGDFQS